MNYFDMFFANFGGGRGDRFEYDQKAAAALIFRRLMTLVLNRFKYTGLPESVDVRYLEMCLLTGGKAAFHKEGNDIFNYAAIISGSFNRYGYPVSIELMDYMGKTYGRVIPLLPGNEVGADGVLMYDNKNDIPPVFRIWWYANRLYLLQSSISTAIHNARAGVIWETNSRAQTRAIEKALKALDDGKPFIITYGEENDLKDPPKITCNIQTPEILKTLTETYDKTLADFLTEFGINANGVINKLSGVGDLELNQNVEATQIALNAFMESRRKGLERLNQLYDINASIEPAFTFESNEEEAADNDTRETDI